MQDGIIQSDLIQLNIKKPQQGKLGPRRKGNTVYSFCPARLVTRLEPVHLDHFRAPGEKDIPGKVVIVTDEIGRE